MPVVTNKKYYFNEGMINITEKCLRRQKKKFDHLFIYDGDEGIGKTTAAVAHANYLAFMTGKKFSVDNVFFDPEKMMKFAAETEEQVILWDEAALGGLGDDYFTDVQRKLVKILMVARKKRHFWIFCVPKFHTLREYIAVDRAIGLIHVYSHDDENRGRFVYFRKRKKDFLYHRIRKTKLRNYKGYSFRGKFVDVTKKPLIDWKAYEKKKDATILKMFANPISHTGHYRTRFIKERYNLCKLAQYCKVNFNLPFRRVEDMLKMDHSLIPRGLRLPKKYPDIFGEDQPHGVKRDSGTIT